MKLRARLAATTLGVLTPAVFGLLVWDGYARHEAAAATLAHMTLDRVTFHNACAGAQHLGRHVRGPLDDGTPPLLARGASGEPGFGPPPNGDGPPGDRPPGPFKPFGRAAPPVVFTYAADSTPLAEASPALPFLPPDGTPWQAAPASWWQEEVVIVARAPATVTDCRYLLVRGSTVPGFLGSILPQPHVWATPIAAVLAIVLLAMQPVVRRIRRLADAARALPSTGWRLPPQPGPADELGDLAHALHTAADAVRAEMAAQTAQADALRAFVADTGHDVMIPLTVLQGHLAALRDEHPASDRVTSAMQEAHYLGGILRNLAAAARLETSHRTDPVDLTELVTRVAARHRPVAAAAGVELGHAVPDGPVFIAGDVTLLEQAVSNVVYNAVRHNRPGGHAAVTLDAHAGRFTLTVLDDGPGVSPDALARLGERGFRADETRSRGTTGEGIGLDITLRVARLHGIEVTFSAGDEAGLQVVMRGGVAAR